MYRGMQQKLKNYSYVFQKSKMYSDDWITHCDKN